MPVSTLWTALPTGVNGDALLLSTFVSFRVTTPTGADAALSTFPDLTRWPDSLTGLSFQVQFDAAAPVAATVTSAAPSLALWQALFSAEDTLVHSHTVQDFSGNPRRSFSVHATRDLLRDLHIGTALASPGKRPNWSRRGEEQLLPRLRGFALTRQTARSIAADPPPNLPQTALAQLIAFYARTDDAQQPSVPLPTPDQLRARFDFHAILTGLGNHPGLLRSLGLVFDLTVPTSALTSSPGTPRKVRVLPSWQTTDPQMTPPASPATLATYDGTNFIGLSATGDIEDGYLVLDGELQRYNLVELDVEGGVLKAATFAMNVIDNRSNVGSLATAETLSGTGLPTLRSAGLSLVRDDRADHLGELLATNAVTEAAMTTTNNADIGVTAEQLVRGYRLDFWDSASRSWHSVCQRIGTYHIVNNPSLDITITDEGFVQLATSSTITPAGALGVNPTDELYIHESLARWDGWSLAAPRPGLGVSHETDPETLPAPGDTSSGTTAGLEVSYRATGLPKLRFGTGYRVRVRVVDLAGNSRAVGDTNDRHALPQDAPGLIYRRFEPVAAPKVVPPDKLGPDHPGESLQRLVIRTFNATPAKDGDPIQRPAMRHIAPPVGSVALAEAHGMLDAPDGSLRGDQQTYQMLHDRDGAALPVDDVSDQQLAIPYLPDPLARGAALRDLPGTTSPTRLTVDHATGTLTTVSLTGTDPRPGSATLLRWSTDAVWPALPALRLVITDGDGAPEWSATQRILQVHLPKAHTATVPLSSFVDADDLQVLGVWEWLRQALEPGPHLIDHEVFGQGRLDAVVTLFSQLAVEGGLPQLTPDRALTLVHAVQQPLGLPTITTLSATRAAGATAAALSGLLTIHGRSTSKVDLRACWQDPIDDPNTPAPSVLTGQGTAAELVLDDPQQTGPIRIAGESVGWYDTATDTLALGFPPAPNPPSAFPQHEFHDHKHRVVSYTAAAASAFREYFATDVPGGVTRTGPTVEVAIPSSRRPDAPRIRYVVPTFGWEREEETNLRTHQRTGGLRVFLDRPWYSSGAGELLGVVLWESPPIPPNRRDQLARYITRAGSDPLYLTSAPANQLSTSHFPDTTATGLKLKIDELPNDVVDVAGHAVQWDNDRHQWFCDLRVNLGTAYHPWIRLALARYQPGSIPGVELSRVVLADFAALPMDRSLLLTYDPFRPDDVAVTVSGTTYNATAALLAGHVTPGGSEVQVSIERAVAGVTDPDLRWQPAPEVTATPDTDAHQDALLWHGHIALPTGRTPGDYRIVIREVETLLADPTLILFDQPPTVPTPRVVFADTFIL